MIWPAIVAGGKAFLASKAGSAIAGGLAGGLAQGAFGLKAQDYSQDFSREVMQNKHQWEVQDLRKAGLNPVLSAMGGMGGIAGPGAMPTAPDFAGSAAKGMQIKLMKAQEKTQQALTQKEMAQADILDSQNMAIRGRNRALEEFFDSKLGKDLVKFQAAQEMGSALSVRGTIGTGIVAGSDWVQSARNELLEGLKREWQKLK